MPYALYPCRGTSLHSTCTIVSVITVLHVEFVVMASGRVEYRFNVRSQSVEGSELGGPLSDFAVGHDLGEKYELTPLVKETKAYLVRGKAENLQALQRRRSGQRDVRLALFEHLAEVHLDAVESCEALVVAFVFERSKGPTLALRLVDGHCPGKNQGQLLELASALHCDTSLTCCLDACVSPLGCSTLNVSCSTN